jgi:carbohydrate kinase (thermoresistant glucokinase family)
VELAVPDLGTNVQDSHPDPADPVESDDQPRSFIPKPGTVSSCRHITVMGVSGSGKTTVGRALAEELGFELIEGDDSHPPENVAKMAAGIPLTDEDRHPWLATLAALLADRHGRGEGTVLACSALRRSYRDILRSAVPDHESFFIQLDADEETLRSRMKSRKGHYMPPALLESQLATLEALEPDEPGVVLDATQPPDIVVAEAVSALRSTADRT